MTRKLGWLPAAFLVVLAAAGVWLVVAPFTVGQQPQGAAWTVPTRNDLVSGAVLLVACLLTLAASLTAAVHARTRQSAPAAAGVSLGATGMPAATGPAGVRTQDVGARDAVEVTARCRLTGHVRSSASGSPIGEALVTLIDVTGTVVGAASTGPDGEYAFDDIPEGSYTLTAAGYAPTATGIRLSPGMSASTDITLTPPQPTA